MSLVSHVRCDYQECPNITDTQDNPTWVHVSNGLDFCCEEHMAYHYGAQKYQPSTTIKHSNRGGRRQVAKHIVDKFIERYTAGDDVETIARDLGYAKATVYRYLNLGEV